MKSKDLETTDAADSPVVRKAGRPRRQEHAEKFSVTLRPDLGEWGKGQPEGLSGLISKLLESEMALREEQRQESPHGK